MPVPNRSARASARYVTWLALIACPLLLVGCGGSSAPDDSEARSIIERFMEQLRTGKVDAAWESTTADFKSDEGRDTFRQYVRERDVLSKPLEFVELTEVEVHGLTRWVGILRTPADQADQPVTVRTTIAQESGVWKVERIEVE